MLKRLREWMGEPAARIARDAGEYWSESREDPDKRMLSHWRGEGRWADEQAWLGIGRGNLERFAKLRDYCGAAGPFDVMAEWGPGGGSNAVAFLGTFQRFHGIDISAANLEECARQAAEASGTFLPHHIAPEKPEDVRQTVGEPLDFFLSTAVFQHFPGKEYGLRVLATAHAMLRPGGLALIQTRYDDGNERYRPRRANYRENAVTFTSYAVEEFWNRAAEVGFEPLMVTLLPRTNYATYGLRRPG